MVTRTLYTIIAYTKGYLDIVGNHYRHLKVLLKLSPLFTLVAMVTLLLSDLVVNFIDVGTSAVQPRSEIFLLQRDIISSYIEHALMN